jgi:hypothetical protein
MVNLNKRIGRSKHSYAEKSDPMPLDRLPNTWPSYNEEGDKDKIRQGQGES